MTRKSFSLKNLILILTLLIITLATALVGGASVVRADTKENAINDINIAYSEIVEIIGTEDEYNAQRVIDKIKSSAEYTLSNCDSGEVKTIKDKKLQELKLIKELILVGESLKEHAYEELKSENYTEQHWDNINYHLNEFIKLINIEELFSKAKITQKYLDNLRNVEYPIAKEKIDNVEQKEIVDLTELEAYKKATILELEDILQRKYRDTGYYDDYAFREVEFYGESEQKELKGIRQQINEANTFSAIDSIKGKYVKNLRQSRTYLENLCERYFYYCTYPIENGVQKSPDDISNKELEEALADYFDISKNLNIEDTLFEGDMGRVDRVCESGNALFDYYRTRMSERIRASYDWQHYSKEHLSEITLRERQAQDHFSTCTSVEEVQREVRDAINYIISIPKNVSSVTIQDYDDRYLSKYEVTITSSNPFAFTPESFVVATDYTYKPVKTNVNRLLNRVELDGKNKDYRLSVKYYLDFKIYYDIDTMTEQPYREYKPANGETFTISIVMDEKFQEKVGNNIYVVFYDGEIKGYDRENYTLDQSIYNVNIEKVQGEKILMFDSTNLGRHAVCGNTLKSTLLLDKEFYLNPFFYFAVFFIMILVIIIIVLILKHFKYKVVFINNGGTRVKTRKFKNTEPIEMPVAPTKEGFMFGGWFTDKTLKRRFVQNVMTRHKIKLFAKWIPLSPQPTVDDYYKALRACLDDFERVGASVGFEKEDKVARIIISNDKVLLYLAGETKTFEEMGYNVIVDEHPDNVGIQNKFVIQSADDLYKALECIDIVMAEKGLMEKDGDPEIKEISAEEREKGYLFAMENETVAESLKDYFELLRLQSKSYVMMGDGGTPRDLSGKYIVKAKKYDDCIKLYLPYETEGATLVEGEKLYKDVPYLYTITDAESCKVALKVIADSMISIGMTKYPRNAKLIKGAGDEETAFGYKIRFN